MKKIFSVAMVVCLLALAIAPIGVSATSMTKYSCNGHELPFPDEFDPAWTEEGSTAGEQYYLVQEYGNGTNYRFVVAQQEEGAHLVVSDGSYKTLKNTAGEDVVIQYAEYDASTETWGDFTVSILSSNSSFTVTYTVVWSNVDVYKSDGVTLYLEGTPLVKVESVVYEQYNNVTLPTIDTVWTDKSAYAVAIIFKDKTADNYHLVIGQNFQYDYVHTNTNATGSPECYCAVTNWMWYNLSGDEWVYETGATNSVVCRTETYSMVWTSQPIYTDSTRTTQYTDFFLPTPAVKPPTLVGTMEGVQMTGVLTEVLKMIPVGMACLIGYLALRKALTVLKRVLSEA